MFIYVPDTVLDMQNSVVNNADKTPCLCEIYILAGDPSL